MTAKADDRIRFRAHESFAPFVFEGTQNVGITVFDEKKQTTSESMS